MIVIRIPRITYTNDETILEETISIDEYEEIDYPYIEQSDIKDKLIKKIEKVIRGSYEYREYRDYLREELDLNHCTLFTNLDFEEVNIEIHHGPLTLYDITDIVLRKQMDKSINVTIWDVAEEVTKLHYQNRVGLAPLSVTIHDLLHEGDIFIPYQYFYGDWESFCKEYKDYFTDDQKKNLKHYIKLSNEVINDMKCPDILQRKYTYMKINGIELPKPISIDKKEKKTN